MNPACPKCGTPARVVVLQKARVRCELRDGEPGSVLSATRGGALTGYECGGGHTWAAATAAARTAVWKQLGGPNHYLDHHETTVGGWVVFITRSHVRPRAVFTEERNPDAPPLVWLLDKEASLDEMKATALERLQTILEQRIQHAQEALAALKGEA